MDSSLEECLNTLEDRVLLVGIFQEQLEDNTQEQLEDSIQEPQQDSIQELQQDSIQEQQQDSTQERLEGSIQERLEDSIQERLEDSSLVEHIQELQNNFQEAIYPAGFPDTITLAPAQDSIQRERDNIQEQVEYLEREQVNTTLEEPEVLVPVRALACRVPVVSVNTEDNFPQELDWDNKVEESANIPVRELQEDQDTNTSLEHLDSIQQERVNILEQAVFPEQELVNTTQREQELEVYQVLEEPVNTGDNYPPVV